jgi:hypothetical protein
VPSNDLENILAALSAAGVRYVVVGGVAVVLHGHLRFTADLDLVVALERDNVHRALDALRPLGFQPLAPVSPQQFADPDIRAQWVHEKGMTVFSMWSMSFPGTVVDIFAEEPIPFDELASRAKILQLPATSVVVASIPDLILMKRQAGRPQDLADIDALERILGASDEDR